MSLGKKIISNVFYYFLDFTTLTVFGYLFWILMGKMLPQTQYGILFTILTIFQIVRVFLTMGFNESLPKFISEYGAKKKTNKTKSFIFFSSNIVFYFSLLFSIAVLIYSKELSVLFYGSNSMSTVFGFLSILLFSGAVALVLKAAAQGLQEYRKIFIADLIGSSVKILTSIFLVLLGFQALSGVFGWTLWYTLVIIVMFFTISQYRTRKLNIDKRKFLKFSLYSLVSSVCILILLQGNIFLLSILSDFNSVAIFGVAFLFSQLILFIPNILFGSLLPNISELWVINKKKVKILVSLSIKLITITVLPLLILFIVFSKPLISVFYSELYVSASQLFPAFLLGTFLFGISNIALITIYSAYKPFRRLIILFFGTVLSVLLSILLIPIYGLFGAVYSYLFSNFVIFGLSLYSLNKTISLSFSRKTILLIPSLLLFTVILYFVAPIGNLLIKIIVAAVDSILYLLVLLNLGVINKNDTKVLDYLPNSFGLTKIKRTIKRLVK